MTQQWQPGAVVSAGLHDGRWYAARLLEFPWVALYDGSDAAEPLDRAGVVARPVLRILAVNSSLLASGWTIIGERPLEPGLHPPELTFVQDDLDPHDLRVLDRNGMMRPATVEECRGLEAAAVWAPEHLAELLVAHARGEVDEHTRALALVVPDDTRGANRPDGTST
jgi:hypothetical protein